MKKFFAGFALSTIIFTLPIAWATSRTFVDIKGDEWFSKAAYRLSALGIIQGYKDGTFRGDQSPNRAELAVILDRLLNHIEEQNVKNISFDACGPLKKYEQQPWYTKFVEAIKKQSDVSLETIVEGCYSENGNMFIMVTARSYCTPTSVFKFQTDSSILEKAAMNSGGREGCLTGGISFGKREGSIITMEPGIDGDAGCWTKQYYNYHFQSNIIELVKEESGCSDPNG